MKLKYIKTIDQGKPEVITNEQGSATGLIINCNVAYEIAETGTDPGDFKNIERTIPALQVETSDVNEALTALQAYGLQWLKDTFGEANVIS